MGDNLNSKITFAKNLNKLNFNLTTNIPIDSNTNIKTLLDINAYLFDQKVECGNGKAIITGKVGVKALFLDTDYITNTISDTINFNETFVDASINGETYLNIFNSTITPNILSTDGTLKINFDVSISPTAYMNLSMSNSFDKNDMLITKKSEILTNSVSNFVNSSFEFVSNLETKDSVDKILSVNCYFTPEKITPQDGYAVIEGKLMSCLLYESIDENNSTIKELHDTTRIKQDVEINGLTKDCSLDLSYIIDKSCEEISTELEDDSKVISIKNKINVSGVVLNNVAVEIVDDVYSVENNIETTTSKREFTKKSDDFSITEVISNEVTLSDNEPAIDEVLANLNISSEITNIYIKNNSINLEGVVTSNFTYIDENKEVKHKQIEIPFIIDSKVPAETLNCIHSSIHILDSKVKVKRGTIIELEYSLFFRLSIYEKKSQEIIDTFKIGKPLDFSKYDIQIFIAKPNETMWELCKRIKISPDNIHKYNKNLPIIMQGGERVIIKR